MEDYVGKICPFCKTEIKEGDAVKVCPDCGVPHHEHCWEENQGCAASDCAGHKDEKTVDSPEVCRNCGAPLEEGQAFCVKCGTPRQPAQEEAPKKLVCRSCGAELQEGQAFCPKCGHKVEPDSVETSVVHQPDAQKTNAKKKTMPIVIGVAAVAVVALVIALVGGGKKDFRKMYGDLADEEWCTIASDGSYMKIDTNPDDTDSDDLTWTYYQTCFIPAEDAIERVNKELGFSEALNAKMESTTALQGRQTESNEKYTVSWTYHPDKGLEAMYEFKK